MECKFCGTQMNEDALFCTECGKNINDEETINMPESTISEADTEINENINTEFSEDIDNVIPATEKKEPNRKAPYIMGMIICLTAVFFGLLMLFGAFSPGISAPTSSGDTIYSHSYKYGGDAYTGMQNASAEASNNAATAANNVAKTNSILLKGFNATRKTTSLCSGFLLLFIGAIAFAYFYTGYCKEKFNN